MLRQGLQAMAASPPDAKAIDITTPPSAPVPKARNGNGDYSSWRLPDRIGRSLTAMLWFPISLTPAVQGSGMW